MLKNKPSEDMIQKLKISIPMLALALACGCAAKGDYTGLEYAPQMYHSVPYEPLTQIKDEEAGKWLSNREDEKGEFYNSNPNNPYAQNVRKPVEGTVRRNPNDMLPYRLEKDDITAAAAIENPFPASEEIIAEGRRLYTQFCQHCHGASGKGDGKAGVAYAGVPSYTAPAQRNLSQGHIFHVITHGIRRMGAHGSQISEDKRWKIARYVQTLQQQ
ncbi:c-type cytochrome [Roseivirga sp. UBA1976]|uniref:c-type cytochrome n=1 Tax=Roseivirga sp. UBA1976 TaxID=1947386 RepID=UPI00257F7FFB|nr:cytochrome c [Roseivirga sp. UBA1976]